jgi:hypothetical protein
MNLWFVMLKSNRTRRPVGTKTAVDHILRFPNFDKIYHMSPAAVSMSCVGIGSANSGPSHVVVKTQTIEDVVVELVYFHTVATTIGIFTCWVRKNNFVEKMGGRDVDDVMPRVVLRKVFPRDFNEMVLLKEAQVRQFLCIG